MAEVDSRDTAAEENVSHFSEKMFKEFLTHDMHQPAPLEQICVDSQ